VRSEGFYVNENPLTPAGIEPATFQFVAQHLSHCATAVPKTNHNNSDNNWITLGIKTSCRHKRELYLISRNSNDKKLKRHYQARCRILLKVVKEAKKLYYDTKIKKSNNKCKATWEIIKKLTNNHYSHTDIQEQMTDNKHLKDQ